MRQNHNPPAIWQITSEPIARRYAKGVAIPAAEARSSMTPNNHCTPKAPQNDIKFNAVLTRPASLKSNRFCSKA